MAPQETARRMSVLLVDDEPAVVDALRRRLRSLRKGWNVLTASGGSAAVAVLETQTVDAVVTDMRMPGMNGLAVLERTRELQPNALRIVLSGQIEPANAEATRAVAHHCLTKPCSVETILALLDGAGHAATTNEDA